MKTNNSTVDEPWYGAKCVFLHRDAPKQGEGQVYEERIVVIRANNATEALQWEGFRGGLKAYLDDARAFRDWRQGDAVIEDDAIQERLRALGYLQ